MNTRDPDRDVDDLLGDDGGKIGNLYRRLPRYEPPRRLDRAVLGEAARAVHSGKPPRRQRWVVGLGSAAGLVLAAGIAWRVGHDAMIQNESALPTAAPRVVPVQPISESARAKREDQPARPPSESDAMRAESPAADRVAGKISSELKSEPRKTLKLGKPAAPPAIPSPAQRPAAAPPAPPPAQAFPNAARELERTQDRKDSSAPASETRAAAAGAAVEKSAAGAARTLASPTAPSGSVELQRDMQLAPVDWLAHIRQLDQQGRRQQATESLRLFRRAHPDWTIPDDLRALLD
ncbi:MAG TPA: hypothetical protein VGO25_14365 [Rhodanobacteraceae bacterium]|jgi:hypothetical protein|nr:hypothetical protein [Rhodanobacteraceae bacterium]